MLTLYADKAFVIDAVQAGAGGYLLKDASRHLLCHTIRAVSSGGILIKSSLLCEAMPTLADMATSHQGKEGAALIGMEEFTPGARSLKIARGWTDKQGDR
jgi:DNA-binding NarL/FixJ family response regulator